MQRRAFLQAAARRSAALIAAAARPASRRDAAVRPRPASRGGSRLLGRDGAQAGRSGADQPRARHAESRRCPSKRRRAPTAPPVTHLEAVGRLLAGLAPGSSCRADDSEEGRLRGAVRDLARQGLAQALDPASPDRLNFTDGGQPLVDAAFLAHAVLRAPRALRDALEPATRERLIAALESTRRIQPGFNNWLLFSATVEAALAAARRRRGIVCASTTRCGSTSSGTRATGSTATARSFIGTTTTASSSTRCCWTCSTRSVTRSPAWQRAAGAGAAAGRALRHDPGAPDRAPTARSRQSAARSPTAPAPSRRWRRSRCGAGSSRRSSRRRCAAALTAVLRRTLDAPGTFDAAGLAAHRPRRPPAGHRRALHLHRQPVSLRHGAAAARPAVHRSVLGGARRNPGPRSGRGRARPSPSITPWRVARLVDCLRVENSRNEPITLPTLRTTSSCSTSTP